MLSTLLIGYGAGTMDLKTPKVLRVFTDEPEPGTGTETIVEVGPRCTTSRPAPRPADGAPLGGGCPRRASHTGARLLMLRGVGDHQRPFRQIVMRQTSLGALRYRGAWLAGRMEQACAAGRRLLR